MTLEALQSRGFKEMPVLGMLPVTVPGTPAGWAALSKRFGRLPLSQVVEPAARYAEEGYVLQPAVGSGWPRNLAKFRKAIETDKSVQGWFDTFLPGGKCLGPGDVLVLKDHAATLREIGATNAESFYRGAWPTRSIPTSASSTASCARRTWRPTSPSGWSPSPSTTRAMTYSRCPPTVTASPPLWH